MNYIESASQNNDEIRPFEKKELFSIEKWKLSNEILLKTLNVVEDIKGAEQQKADKLLAREWKNLDKNAESITNADIKHTEILIAEIEKKFPELKMFAPDQYC